MTDARPWRIAERLLAGQTIYVLYDSGNEPVCHTGCRAMAERLARHPQMEAELAAIRAPDPRQD